MQNSNGFSLIEVLVTIIILGLLSAIALPSYLIHVSKARQTEAITNIAAMNRAQQSYYSEHGDFTPDNGFEELGLGIPNKSENYTYSILQTRDSILDVANIANPNKPDLRGVVGAVAVINGNATTALCQGESPGVELGWDNVVVRDVAVNEDYVWCGVGVIEVR